MSERPDSLPPLAIDYTREAPAALLAGDGVLAVIALGTDAVELGDPRAIRVGLEIVGDPIVEVWRGSGTILSGREGPIRWSRDADYGFFAIEMAEPAGEDIASAAEEAYRILITHIRASATPHVLRLWNYFDAINLGEGDEERYRRFCVGRSRGMAGFWQERYPAATAIGRRDGVRVLQVYALAARAPGVPVENPRQVNAWRYPREYGPTPPTFARGMRTPAGQLLISGTAAVVGSRSRHADDVSAQLDETLANLESLIGSANADRDAGSGAGSVLKAYLRHGDDASLVSTRLRSALAGLGGLVILEGDVCRRELLVEVDGLTT